ncbi:Homeobox-leucine zipper protein ATHB-23 [Glycine max]|nr:Homeobox-leucine zipper protein ATHB-23 [Glycine max]
MHKNPNRAIRGGALESTINATIANRERLSDYIETFTGESTRNSITLFFCWYSSFFASLSSRYSSSQDTGAGYWIKHGYHIIGAFSYRYTHGSLFYFVLDLTFLANDIPSALYFTGVGNTHHSLPLLRIFAGILAATTKFMPNTYSIRVAKSLALRWCIEVIEPTKSINLNKETDGSSNNRSENSSEINLDISRTPTIDSPLSTQQSNSRTLFPSSARPTGVAQLFQTTSRAEIQCQKIDHMVKEESLSNMFCGIDDQSGLWPWLEQQHFN